MAIRQSIRSIESDPQALGLLRSAYSEFKNTSDDRGFDFFAALHGLSLPVWCEHGSPLFLPWHRAYLYYFELALQTRLGPKFTETAPRIAEFSEIGLPWWDWASDHSHNVGLPQSYSDALPGGADNPLRSTAVGASPGGDLRTGIWSEGLVQLVRQALPGAITDTDPPTTLRDPDPADDLPRQSTLDNVILQQNTFGTFNFSLEQVHNDVHVWVGGAMSSVPTAAYDPIFWSHHCMIDRIWYIWQNSLLGSDPPVDLLNTILAPFPMTVAQVLDIDRLGYDYAVMAIS